MNILRRKYFIYPEIQLPLMKQTAIGLTLLTILQISGVVLSMYWLESVAKADMSIVVDQRVLGPWKILLFLSVFIPVVLNLAIGLFIVLFVSITDELNLSRFIIVLFRRASRARGVELSTSLIV